MNKRFILVYNHEFADRSWIFLFHTKYVSHLTLPYETFLYLHFNLLTQDILKKITRLCEKRITISSCPKIFF